MALRQRTGLGRNPPQFQARLTLETVRIFLSTKNGTTNIDWISFRQGLDWEQPSLILGGVIDKSWTSYFFDKKRYHKPRPDKFRQRLDWGTNLKNWGPIGRLFAITFSVTVPQISAG
jgi:hypothetical protein